jgi:hypothetical protein
MNEPEEKELLRRISIVNEQCSGIAPEHEAFYLHSILYSAELSLAAFDRYEDLIKIKANATLLISTIQEAIGHAGALSRYFWASKIGPKSTKEKNEMRKNRAKKLRNKFGLTETSPLKERSLRDAWEHFDERLDIFLISNISGYFFPAPILDKHTLADEPVGKIFKLLDIEAHCLVLLGKKYFFIPIQQEVLKVYDYAINAIQNGGRL